MSPMNDEWAMACRCFLNRHLLAHKPGVVDDKYITQARDLEAKLWQGLLTLPLPRPEVSKPDTAGHLRTGWVPGTGTAGS